MSLSWGLILTRKTGHGEAAEFIPACVIEIAAYWRKRRPTPTTGSSQPVSVSLKADQPGRNDPCPCGSGRQYKVCCGRLH